MAVGHSLIKRVLFATDFSTCAHHAEEYVAFLSTVYGAPVEVLHVLELYPGMYPAVQDHRETDARLADVVRRIQRQMTPMTGHQIIGIPSVQICQAAMRSDADLIVLGTHGRTGLEHILLGSIAERVLTMAPCPVLTVREPEGSERRHTRVPLTFKQITVPVDFSDCSMDALEYGIQIAKDVNLLQAVWTMPTSKNGKSHKVPLPPQLVGLLCRFPQTDPWVFGSPRAHGGGIKKSTSFHNWRRIRARAGLNDVTIHDLRRSCASWMALTGRTSRSFPVS